MWPILSEIIQDKAVYGTLRYTDFLCLSVSSHSNNFKPENRRVSEFKINKERGGLTNVN